MVKPTSKDSSEQGAIDNAILAIARELASEIHKGSSFDALVMNSTLDADTGLDSLSRVELVYRIQDRLQLVLDETCALKAETYRDLADCIEEISAIPEPAAITEKKETTEIFLGTPDKAATLNEVINWHADKHPDRTCITFYNRLSQAPEKLSYAQLRERAGRVAGSLRALDIEAGDRVAIMQPSSLEFFYAFAGILLAGAIPVPIYPPSRSSQAVDHLQRQSRILDNAGCRLLITIEEAKKAGDFLFHRLPMLKGIMTIAQLLQGTERDTVIPQPDSLAFLQYTSGSTGNPKGVMLTHSNLLANIRSMGKALKVSHEDVFVSWLPLYHDMGLIGAWMGSLYFGFPLVLMSPLTFISKPVRWLKAISLHKATLSAAPNFAYDLCLDRIRDKEMEDVDLSSLRFCCNGAEPVSPITMDRFCEHFQQWKLNPGAVSPVFGLAEACVGLCFPPVNRGPVADTIDSDSFWHNNQARVAEHSANTMRISACGLPLAGHEIRIIDDAGRELPERMIGHLQFRGPSACQGYYNNPEATAGLFDHGWLNTGDYAYIAAGELYLTGREKDLIIRAGRNIYPYEAEKRISGLDGIHRGGVAIFPATDRHDRQEKIVVLAETRARDKETHQRLREEIIAVCSNTMQVAPDDIVLAPPRTVLKTSSGKIKRSACRQLYETGKLLSHQNKVIVTAKLAMALVTPALKRFLRKSRENLYALYAWVVFLLLAVPTALITLLIPGASARRSLMRAALTLTRWLLGIRADVYGKENLPDEPCVIVANHASYIDAFIIGLALPSRFQFVAKAELARYWPLNRFLRGIGTHFVERFDAGAARKDSEMLTEAVSSGQSIILFPEGTFTRASGLQVFKMGAFVSAVQANMPVVPVAIRGTRNILRGSSWFPRRGSTGVTITPALRATADNEWRSALDLKERARQAILEHCGEPDLQ